MPVKQYLNKGKIHAKLWLDDLESGAFDQLTNLTNLPFAFHHVAAMPDCHQGFGMPIGGVLATNGIIIPNAVGVDIGCGMVAVKVYDSSVSLDQEDVKRAMGIIRANVPVGFDSRTEILSQEAAFLDKYSTNKLAMKFIGKNTYQQVGTLGGGNHFIEIQKDLDNNIWIMIHSGSRNLGKRVCEHFNQIAKDLNSKYNSVVPPSWDLAFLPEDSSEANDYLYMLNLCCEYAQHNRSCMAKICVDALCQATGTGVIGDNEGLFLDVKHNYAVKENHFGENVWIHRKGAVRARTNELVIIPGSQGTKSYIARGLGNPDSFESCSHGAGRRMSRSAASKTLDLQEQIKILDDAGVVHGIRTQKDLDEAPGAYKDIDEVMENQSDLVEIVHVLTPVGVVKG